MKVRLSKSIWLGLVASILLQDIQKGVLVTFFIELIMSVLIGINAITSEDDELVPKAFITSIILPNTSPYKPYFTYTGVLFRVHIRILCLFLLFLYTNLWPIFLPLILLTMVYIKNVR